ncbi:MAG: site-2 protease family protein [Thermomicrobiales bacterium]|nr:site-2 protease family protein [Thermomicrobiales bacterium]
MPISLRTEGHLPRMQYLAIVPILAFLIVIHELGHFFAARSVGVKVEEFGIGLPPRVKGWRRNGVLWSINALPIGGFVRVKGEDANDREPGSMQIASPWARMWFLLAGPLANLLTAVIISVILVASTGRPAGDRVFIELVEPGMPAEAAGWRPGDRIVAIDGITVESTAEASTAVRANIGRDTEVIIQRGNETLVTHVTPMENPPAGRGSTGIIFSNSRLSNVSIDTLTSSSPAAAAGMQPGDEIKQINGVKVESLGHASGLLNSNFGQETAITYERNGVEHTAQVSVPVASLAVSEITPNTPAAKAELFRTDQITAVNGIPITTGQVFIDEMIAASGTTADLSVTRFTANGPVELETTLAIPDVSAIDRGEVLSTIGFGLLQPNGFSAIGLDPIGEVRYEPVPTSRIIPEGWHQFTYMIAGTIDAIRQMFSGNASLDSFIGPIGMGQLTGEILDQTKGNPVPILLNFTMMISISLGLMNLLPIPALDGGRLLFVIVEILRGGKRVPPEKEGAVHMVGMLLLLGLIFVIAFGDINRIITGESLFR